MDIDRETLVYSGPVIEFVAVANEMCTFLEQADSFARADFVDKSRKILPLLYYKATLLPSTEAIFEDGTERFVTEEDWQSVHDGVLQKLGRYNDYPEVLDPVIKDTEDKVGGSIAENLADIYQDIKDFVMLYRMGTVELMNDALWECMQHFDQNWGQKLLNSLRALHYLLHGAVTMEDEDEEQGGEGEQITSRDTDKWIFSQRQKLWNEDEDED
ncbi:MAG: DUF5063 domain-containing protein [Bacteroidales bacterium]